MKCIREKAAVMAVWYAFAALILILQPFGSEAVYAESGSSGFNNVVNLSLNKSVDYYVYSEDDYPTYSFTPKESGTYEFRLTTSGNLGISGVTNVYKGTEYVATFPGKYFLTDRLRAGFVYENIQLDAGQTYYFTTAPYESGHFKEGGLTCSIKRVDPGGDNSIEISANSLLMYYVQTKDDFPILSFTPEVAGEYELRISTADSMDIIGDYIRFADTIEEYRGGEHIATLTETNFSSSSDSPIRFYHEYKTSRLEAGQTYYYVLSAEESSYSSNSKGILSIYITRSGREEMPKSDVPLQLMPDRSIRYYVDSNDDFLRLSYTPKESGTYELKMNASGSLHISGTMDEFRGNEYVGNLSGKSQQSSTDGPGYVYTGIKLEAGQTYYFTTAQDSRYSFGKGVLTCSIRNTDLKLDHLAELTLKTPLNYRIDSRNDYPTLAYHCAVSGAYELRLSTSPNLQINRSYPAIANSIEVYRGTEYIGELHGEYTLFDGIFFRNLQLEAGETYYFLTRGEDHWDNDQGYMICEMNFKDLVISFTVTFNTNGGTPIEKAVIPGFEDVDLSGFVPTKERYAFWGWYYDKALTKKVSEMSLTEDVTVYAKWIEPPVTPEKPFNDVAADDYFHNAVYWAVDHDITKGTSETTFSPNMACSRSQMVTFLWRAEGCPKPSGDANPFTDVDKDSYYYDSVLWAVENGITKGTSETTFSPNDTVTRGQAVTFLYRTEEGRASGNNPFTDVKAGEDYYDAVLWAVSNGITTGTSPTTFSPNNKCLRSQIVTFLYRYLK